MIAWIQGWWITFKMWLFDRDTYDYLTNYEYDAEDFGEVPRPL